MATSQTESSKRPISLEGIENAIKEMCRQGTGPRELHRGPPITAKARDSSLSHFRAWKKKENVLISFIKQQKAKITISFVYQSKNIK